MTTNKPTTSDTVSWLNKHINPTLLAKIRLLSERLRGAVLLRDSHPKPEPGFYDGVRRLDNEFDLEIMVNIQEVAPNSRYLTLHRNKPRPTSVENLYYLVDLPKPPVAAVS